MSIFNVLSMIGGLALFLYGMHLGADQRYFPGGFNLSNT